MKSRQIRAPGARLVAGAALLAAGLLLSACSGASTAVLGSHPVNVCYRAVPVARQAVRGAGRLVTVAHTDAATMLKMIRAAGVTATPPSALRRAHEHVCLVAWRGHFSARAVTAPWSLGSPPTPFAVVVVGDPNIRTLATILVGHQPAKLARALSLTG